MTTGTRGFNTLAAGRNSYDFRQWSGSDGKYTIVNGKKIYKCNAYWSNYEKQTATPTNRDPSEFLNAGYNYYAAGFTNNDTLKLLEKIASSVRGHDFHLGKAVAEGHQLVNMVVNTIGTVATAVRSLKHGDLESCARALGVRNHTSKLSVRDVSGRWLELQYGWLPLLSDVWEATRAYHALTSPPLSLTIKKGTHRIAKYNGSGSPTTYDAFGEIELIQRMIYTYTEELSAPRSLGLEDPLGIAWEITPFSFIADWFMPIGTYLDVLNIAPRMTGSWVKTQVRICTVPFVKPTPLAGTAYNGATASFFRKEIVRSVGQGFRALDIPLPNIIPVGEALSPVRIANAIALAHQKMGTSQSTPKQSGDIRVFLPSL